VKEEMYIDAEYKHLKSNEKMESKVFNSYYATNTGAVDKYDQLANLRNTHRTDLMTTNSNTNEINQKDGGINKVPMLTISQNEVAQYNLIENSVNKH